MPCFDGRENCDAKTHNKANVILCGLRRAMGDDAFRAAVAAIDWDQAGVEPAIVDAWIVEHEAHDCQQWGNEKSVWEFRRKT